MTRREWRINLPWPAPLIRENDRPHWAEKARLTKTLRYTAWALAKQQKLPTGLDRVRITLHWQPATNRHRDENAPSPTLKALVDGLVDAGLVADDDAAHVEPRCAIEPVAKPAATWLTIEDRSEAA